MKHLHENLKTLKMKVQNSPSFIAVAWHIE